MRTDRTDDLPRTGITSLATATGIVVFVAWMASFALPHESIFTHDLSASAPAAQAAQQARAEAIPSPD